VDKTSDFDGLTEEHREHIRDAVPDVEISAEAWAELEEVLAGFCRLRSRRQGIKEDRRRWRHIGDLVVKLAEELRQLRRRPWSDSDPQWPDRGLRPDRVLDALREVHQEAENRGAYYATQAAFGGRQNPHRGFLHEGVLRVWTERLGGGLRFSNSPSGGSPYGPLIRFFIACVAPVMGDETPQPSGVAEIIDRERRRRRRGF
jgi:hypothetical protein